MHGGIDRLINRIPRSVCRKTSNYDGNHVALPFCFVRFGNADLNNFTSTITSSGVGTRESRRQNLRSALLMSPLGARRTLRSSKGASVLGCQRCAEGAIAISGYSNSSRTNFSEYTRCSLANSTAAASAKRLLKLTTCLSLRSS